MQMLSRGSCGTAALLDLVKGMSTAKSRCTAQSMIRLHGGRVISEESFHGLLLEFVTPRYWRGTGGWAQNIDLRSAVGSLVSYDWKAKVSQRRLAN